MSGICGIFESGREIGSREVEPMLEALALPDEMHRETRGLASAEFGVARRWGFQQLGFVEGVLVAADADLVDRSALTGELDPPPAQADQLNIAELLAKLYLRRGTDFLQLLHGGFALALWDSRSQRLLFAIDKLGIRSLYWRLEGDRVLFASRIGAIRSAQNDAPEASSTAVLQFLLFSAVPAPLTIDRNTQKLRPGTFVLLEAGQVRERQYWDLEYPESENRDKAYWARELREGMRAAVHRHIDGLEPDGTGAYLSGGTDSSSVVAFISERHSSAQSFSIAFAEAGFSEAEFARTASQCFRTRHHEKWLSSSDVSNALQKLVEYYEEPFANSSAIGSYYCAQLARESGVTTLLAGDGGDELFGGNERYATDKRFALYQRVPRWLRRGFIEPLAGFLPNGESKWSLPRRYVRRANILNPRRILSYSFFLSVPPEEIFEDSFLQEVGASDWLAIPESHFWKAKTTSELNRILYTDLKITLADNDLRKVSGTAELAGVNVRYPLLDDRLAELSGRIPATLKLKGFEKRYIFKQAMKEILPPAVLHKKKHGFGVPLAQWLLGDPRMYELMLDVMHDSRTRQRGYFRKGFFEQLMRLHRIHPNFYGEIVWYLMALELWHRQHHERSRDTVHAT